VNELWIMGPGRPAEADTVAVETTKTVERKLAALMCHKSQMPDPADAIGERIRTWALAAGESAGLSAGRSAELYRVIRIP
jgi:LmbE family N-acetylglucosaminyl deacetylase